MCGIILVSSSSKKRLNSSRICVVPSSLYSKQGDMLPSQFNVPLKNYFQMPWLCHIFQEYGTEFFKGNFVCWTCSKSINLNRNFWCKQHVYHLKGLTINSASSLTFFDRVFNITIKDNVEVIEFARILYTQSCWLDYIFKYCHIL